MKTPVTHLTRQALLRPQEAALLARQKDIKVCAERDAGALVGFPNGSYAKVGAEIVDETAIWGGCDAVVKFKSPSIHQLFFYAEEAFRL